VDIKGLNIGFAMTGSFCTFSKVVPQMERLRNLGCEVYPIMSEMSFGTDTRFGEKNMWIKKIRDISSREIITTIKDAEPIGPRNILDALIIAPCTGNTLSKIAYAMTDSCVAMAAKANLRNDNPLVIAVSTNDGLSASLKNIGLLMNAKNIFFVPFGQDDCDKKPTSLVAKMNLIEDTLKMAVNRIQIQPVLM